MTEITTEDIFNFKKLIPYREPPIEYNVGIIYTKLVNVLDELEKLDSPPQDIINDIKACIKKANQAHTQLRLFYEKYPNSEFKRDMAFIAYEDNKGNTTSELELLNEEELEFDKWKKDFYNKLTELAGWEKFK